VPGVTAASGCSAYCGIPLTHRGLSRGVHFITGHFSNDEPLDIDWAKVADPDSTLVIYMGLANLSLISASLIQAGLLASTPAAAIENGTTTRQRRVLSTLAQLDVDVTAAGVMAPAMIIIGNVVSLAHELDWFQQALESTSDFDEQNIAARH
jgi:uroporphyrin-III C-methyltransferase/precorrin-2 dehydrogenase/sirohydrochlorin ferrochelatase/uroporphyrin-III C-methyltransferase